MKIKILPSRLSGKVDAIPSKSHAHRTLIASALSEGISEIIINKSSEDIDATVGALSEMGADIKKSESIYTVKGIERKSSVRINAKESGTTLRLLLPVACTLSDTAYFEGCGRLPDRPIKELLDAMRSNGAVFSSDRIPLTKTGVLKCGRYEISGNVSSQFVSGLLFALPLLEGDSEIVLTSPLESRPYVDMTVDVLHKFGVKTEEKGNSFFVKGSQKFIAPKKIQVEGDWSNAAFFITANSVREGVEVTGLSENSLQGDKSIYEILSKFDNGGIIDISNTPDLFPILAVRAALGSGVTRFIGHERLRYKESDRVKTTLNMINSLGGNAVEADDNITVFGGKLTGGIVDGAGDHRIVMAASVAATFADGETIINGAEAVAKSYPEFFEDLKKLGGIYYVV